MAGRAGVSRRAAGVQTVPRRERRAAAGRQARQLRFQEALRRGPRRFGWNAEALKMRYLAALLVFLVSAIASAQTFPVKPVRLVVPFPPGGATDVVGRMLAAKMQEVWGHPVIVENKPGAGTVLATDFVAKSAADGYTLGMVVTAHVINPSLRRDLPYDTLKDLAAVTQVSVQHLVMAASPERDAAHREYPVIAETLPGVSALSMVGIVVPAGVPRELIAKIRYDIAQAVRSSDLTERMRAQGMEPVGSTPEEFDGFVRAEIEKWARVVKISGAKAD